VRLTYLGGIAMIALVTADCAHPATIASGSANNASLAAGRTYFLLQGTSSGSAAIDDELSSDIELALAAKGWLEVPPEDAQAIVVTHAATPAKHSLAAFYDGWGDWNWRRAGGGVPDSPGEYTPGTVIVDYFSASTRQLLWRGSAPNVVGHDTHGADGTDRRIDRLAQAVPRSDTRLGENDDAFAPVTPVTNILFAQSPVAVVQIDGPAIYQAVPGTEFERVVNTRRFMIRDAAGMHYLKLSRGWMEADALLGTWATAGAIPPGAEQIFDDSLATNRVEQSGPGAADSPAVVVSMGPVTVVTTEGEIQFEALNDTSLLYARNASAPVFKEPTDKEIYVRLAAGWFRAWTTEGPWQRVPDTRLPADFARIPVALLARVPGAEK
jgi:hypothetical protein